MYMFMLPIRAMGAVYVYGLYSVSQWRTRGRGDTGNCPGAGGGAVVDNLLQGRGDLGCVTSTSADCDSKC